MVVQSLGGQAESVNRRINVFNEQNNVSLLASGKPDVKNKEGQVLKRTECEPVFEQPDVPVDTSRECKPAETLLVGEFDSKYTRRVFVISSCCGLFWC